MDGRRSSAAHANRHRPSRHYFTLRPTRRALSAFNLTIVSSSGSRVRNPPTVRSGRPQRAQSNSSEPRLRHLFAIMKMHIDPQKNGRAHKVQIQILARTPRAGSSNKSAGPPFLKQMIAQYFHISQTISSKMSCEMSFRVDKTPTQDQQLEQHHQSQCQLRTSLRRINYSSKSSQRRSSQSSCEMTTDKSIKRSNICLTDSKRSTASWCSPMKKPVWCNNNTLS